MEGVGLPHLLTGLIQGRVEVLQLRGVHSGEVVVEDMMTKGHKLEGSTESTPGTLSSVKVQSSVHDVQPPVTVSSRLVP